MTVKPAAAVQKAAGIPNGMRTATIVAVAAKGISIRVSGGTFSAGVGVLTSYAPAVGDVVAVFRQDSSWLILGPTALSPVASWVKFASLGYQNGWTDRGAGFAFGSYRPTASGVQIIGQVTNGAAQSSGAAIVSGLPAPVGEVASIVATQGTTRPALHIDSLGVLRIYDSTATGIMQFSGTYPLDFPIS